MIFVHLLGTLVTRCSVRRNRNRLGHLALGDLTLPCLDRLNNLVKALNMIEAGVQLKGQVGHKAQPQRLRQLPLQITRRRRESVHRLRSLLVTSINRDEDTGLTQVSGHPNFGDRYKADTRIFEPLNKQVPKLLLNELSNSLGSI